jgi:hypothetical protein
MKNTPKKRERIFAVTFTDGGEVFIQAMDEGHARRIVETNKIWRNSGKEFTRTIKTIEVAKN